MLATFRDWLVACLPKSRVARGIITLASGTAMAQIITICAMPLVTRLYTPAQFGVISLFLAFFGFWAATLSLRYEYALLIAKDDAESHVVHRLALVLVGAMSLLSTPVMWILQRSNLLGFGMLPHWVSFVSVPILMGYGIFMVYRSWALRAGMIKPVTTATIARASTNALTRVLLGIFGLGVVGLFVAELTGAWSATLELARKVPRHFASSKPATVHWGDLTAVARKFVKFAAYETPSTWANQLALALPLPIVASVHGSVAAGWYGLARAMVGIPNTQIGGAVADVFQFELANAVIVGDAARARHLFYKLMRRLTIIGLVPFSAIVAMAPWLVPWVFGSGWKEAGWIAAVIAPWLYAALVVGSLSRVLSVLQVQEYKLIYDMTTVLLFVVVFVVVKLKSLSLHEVVYALSAVGCISYLIYLALLVAVVELRLRR
jgi:O-antigen/teichoic acid export membrane protein